MLYSRILMSGREIFLYQGDAAADEEYWGGKTTKTQVPTVLQLHDHQPCRYKESPFTFNLSSLAQKYKKSLGIFAVTGANVAFWASWPISWSLLRPQRKSSETLTAKGTWRSGEWQRHKVAWVHYILGRYLTLVTCMGESIVRIALEHGKTPQVRFSY